MRCDLCNSTGATYRLVAADPVTVCEQCVAEHLTVDPDDPTCLSCDAPGEYDLAEHTGAITAEDDPDAYEVFAEDIICGDCLADLESQAVP